MNGPDTIIVYRREGTSNDAIKELVRHGLTTGTILLNCTPTVKSTIRKYYPNITDLPAVFMKQQGVTVAVCGRDAITLINTSINRAVQASQPPPPAKSEDEEDANDSQDTDAQVKKMLGPEYADERQKLKDRKMHKSGPAANDSESECDDAPTPPPKKGKGTKIVVDPKVAAERARKIEAMKAACKRKGS